MNIYNEIKLELYLYINKCINKNSAIDYIKNIFINRITCIADYNNLNIYNLNKKYNIIGVFFDFIFNNEINIKSIDQISFNKVIYIVNILYGLDEFIIWIYKHKDYHIKKNIKKIKLIKLKYKDKEITNIINKILSNMKK